MGTGLYIHTQAVDTGTPAGRAMFGMLGIFSQFEREMIVARVSSGLARAKDAIGRDGHFISKAGKKRMRRFGRPNADPRKLEAARRALAKGTGVLKTAKLVGLGTGATVQRLKHAMMVALGPRRGGRSRRVARPRAAWRPTPIGVQSRHSRLGPAPVTKSRRRPGPLHSLSS
jgi:Resolvase, N terminal domain